MVEFGARTAVPSSSRQTIREIKRLAVDWLFASSFPDEQPTWTVDGATVEDGEVLKDALDAFNKNQLGLDCDCE